MYNQLLCDELEELIVHCVSVKAVDDIAVCAFRFQLDVESRCALLVAVECYEEVLDECFIVKPHYSMFNSLGCCHRNPSRPNQYCPCTTHLFII